MGCAGDVLDLLAEVEAENKIPPASARTTVKRPTAVETPQVNGRPVL